MIFFENFYFECCNYSKKFYYLCANGTRKDTRPASKASTDTDTAAANL